MMYDFSYKEIGSLNSKTLKKLQEFVLSIDYKKNPTYFHSEILKTNVFPANSQIITEVIEEIDYILPKYGFVKAMINVLPGETHIPSHSDEGPKSVHKDNLIVHKVHIPIITNAYCSHTWEFDQRAGKVFAKHFEEGKIYLFNNIISHGAVNASKTNRYHLIMRYRKDCFHV